MKIHKSFSTYYIIFGAAVLAIAIFLLWPNNETNNFSTQHSPVKTEDASISDTGLHNYTQVDFNPQVHKKIKEKNSSEAPFRFDVEYIFNAMSKVLVDSNGDVVVNNHAKDLLESAFMNITFDLTESELAELQEFIQLGIPGKAGEQAAKIFTDYYHYRIAEIDFIETHEANDLSEMLSNFEQVVEIRKANLGYDVAEKLYGLDQINNRYTIESMAILSNTNLTEDDRIKQQQLLSQQYELDKVSYHFDDPNFKTRYDQFLQDKQHVIDAKLSQAQEQEQIDILLEQHFDKDVIEKVRRYANLN